MARTLVEVFNPPALDRWSDLSSSLFDLHARLNAAIAAADLAEVERLAGVFMPALADRAREIRRPDAAPAWPESIRVGSPRRAITYRFTGKTGMASGLPSAEYQSINGSIVWLDADRNVQPQNPKRGAAPCPST